MSLSKLYAIGVFFLFIASAAAGQQYVPLFITHPDNISVECEDPIPSVPFVDATEIGFCMVEDVLYSETTIGEEYEVYQVNTADFTDSGILEYGFNSNIVEGAIPRYTWQDNARLFVSDNHAILLGTVRNVDNPSQEFEMFLILVVGQNWDSWSSQLTSGVPFIPRTYRDDLGYAAAGGELWETWRYFEIDGVDSYYGGKGALGGSGGTQTHSPPNKIYAFQIGEAANNVNASFGFTTWVQLEGCVEGEEDFAVGTVSADLVLLGTVEDLYCRDVILRRWKAVDQCGKENTTAQLVYSQQSLLGDFNGDGSIDVSDFISFNTQYGNQCGLCPEDLNGDGFVNIEDFLVFNTLFGN